MPAGPMAAEPLPKALTRKPLLLNKVEGSQEVVNMAAIVPKEDGVISVSEDRYRERVFGGSAAGVCQLPALPPVMVAVLGPRRGVLDGDPPSPAGGGGSRREGMGKADHQHPCATVDSTAWSQS